MTDENNKKESITAKHEAEKQAMLEQLRRIPIIQVACEKAKVSRPTFYRMRAEDQEFKAAVEEAIKEGVLYISDLGESQLVSLIKDRSWPAIRFWLVSRNPAYKTKVDVTALVEHTEKRPLTQEEKELIEKSLRLAMPRAGDVEAIPKESDNEEQPASSGDDANTSKHES